jgi:hypothetical protein
MVSDSAMMTRSIVRVHAGDLSLNHRTTVKGQITTCGGHLPADRIAPLRGTAKMVALRMHVKA